MKLISVIIPTHNRNDLLKKAVSSVLEQTYKNYEILIVDDTADKNAEDTVQKIINSEECKIIYIHNPEPGAPKSRNLGAGKANGSYLAFLDDDDFWYSKKLEAQVTELERVGEEFGMVYTGIDIEVQPYNIVYSNKPTYSGNLYKKLLFRNIIGVTITPLIEKKLFIECGGFDVNLKARMDYDLWIRLSEITKIAVVSEPLARSIIRINMDRISSNLSDIEESIETISTKYASDIQKLFSSDEQKKRQIENYRFLASQAVKLNDRKKASLWYKKAFKRSKSPKDFISSLLAAISIKSLFILRKMLK